MALFLRATGSVPAPSMLVQGRLGLEHVVSFDRDLDAVPSVTRFEP